MKITYGNNGSAKKMGCVIRVISVKKLTMITVINVGVLSKKMERRKSKILHLVG